MIYIVLVVCLFCSYKMISIRWININIIINKSRTLLMLFVSRWQSNLISQIYLKYQIDNRIILSVLGKLIINWYHLLMDKDHIWYHYYDIICLSYVIFCYHLSRITDRQSVYIICLKIKLTFVWYYLLTYR